MPWKGEINIFLIGNAVDIFSRHAWTVFKTLFNSLKIAPYTFALLFSLDKMLEGGVFNLPILKALLLTKRYSPDIQGWSSAHRNLRYFAVSLDKSRSGSSKYYMESLILVSVPENVTKIWNVLPIQTYCFNFTLEKAMHIF